ncbi:MAG: thioesterase family protein [Gemmatimonadetes bacterium]|nr:thioesterase family protein [Gemmatimonadota bacterium]
MNLLFRTLYVLLAALRRERLGPLDESTVTFRVLPNDLDVNLHMNNGRYLTLMDLGRLDLIARIGILGEIRRRRWMPVIGAQKIRYRRSLKPFQKYQLRSRLLCWDDKWFFMEQRFEHRGHLMAIALVKGLFLGPEGQVPTQRVVEVAGVEIASPPFPEPVAAWQEAESVLREYETDDVEAAG